CPCPPTHCFSLLLPGFAYPGFDLRWDGRMRMNLRTVECCYFLPVCEKSGIPARCSPQVKSKNGLLRDGLSGSLQITQHQTGNGHAFGAVGFYPADLTVGQITLDQ